MGISTPHNITLTEGQIGVILCSLEDSVKKSEHYREDRVKGQLLEPFDAYVNEVPSLSLGNLPKPHNLPISLIS